MRPGPGLLQKETEPVQHRPSMARAAHVRRDDQPLDLGIALDVVLHDFSVGDQVAVVPERKGEVRLHWPRCHIYGRDRIIPLPGQAPQIIGRLYPMRNTVRLALMEGTDFVHKLHRLFQLTYGSEPFHANVERLFVHLILCGGVRAPARLTRQRPQDAVDEPSGFGRTVFLGELNGLVDDRRNRRIGPVKHFVSRKPKDVAIDDGLPLGRPIDGQLRQFRVDLLPVAQGSFREIARKSRILAVKLRLLKCGVDHFRKRLVSKFDLVEDAQRQLARIPPGILLRNIRVLRIG